MTISTQAMPRHEQWRLILLLRKAAVGGGFPCPYAVRVSSVDAADLPKLAEYGWIEGLRDRHVIDLAAEAQAKRLATVDLRLTADGRDWLNRSPLNTILFTLYASAGRIGMTPREVKRATNVYDRSWFERLGNARLIKLVRADGEEADMDSETLDVDAPWLRLYLTPRGHDLVSV